MVERKEIYGFCGVCSGNCSVIAVVEDGKLVAIKPDRDRGFRHDICPGGKGPLTTIGTENHPDRLKYPLKRAGKRGEGKWQRISWDQALNEIAEKLLYFKEKFGPESLVLCIGEPKNMETIFGHRFATAFGTPNVATPGGLCGVVRQYAARYTYGRSTMPDYPEDYKDGDPLPELFLEMGIDARNHSLRHSIKTYEDHGVKIAIVDPLKIVTAQRADLWVKARPASDGVLVMGMLKVIIEEELYDKEFVAKWTVGFDKLCEEMKTFTLDDVERVTWVPIAQIQELARLYATSKPAVFEDGNSPECMKNAFNIFRVICILRAITGNLNVPGGEIFLTTPIRVRPAQMMLLKQLGRDVEKSVANDFKLAMKTAFVPWQCVTRSGVEGKPYPLKAAICCLTNPIISYPDSKATLQAFLNMELIVVLELFHTPTTAIADIVLPAAWTWEDDTITYWSGWFEEYRGCAKIVDPPGESWPDAKIFNELAKKAGLEKYFWEDEKESYKEYLDGTGLSFEELVKKGKIMPAKEYKRPEEELFKTPSGKVEIYCQDLEAIGVEPIPTWKTLSKLPGELSEEYPLLVTSAKSNTYMLTGFKMIDTLRKREPEPLVKLHPETAEKLGLKEGEWVYIETTKGRIIQKLALDANLDPRVVIAAFGWWFPEDGPETLYGWDKSNLNILTGYEDPGQPVGAPDLKGLPCKVYRA